MYVPYDGKGLVSWTWSLVNTNNPPLPPPTHPQKQIQQTQPNRPWSISVSSPGQRCALTDWQVVILIMPPVPETPRSVNRDFSLFVTSMFSLFSHTRFAKSASLSSILFCAEDVYSHMFVQKQQKGTWKGILATLDCLFCINVCL